MRKLNIVLTPVEADHILFLLRQNEEEGSYCGNREQYWKRHNRILKEFQEAFAEALYAKS